MANSVCSFTPHGYPQRKKWEEGQGRAEKKGTRKRKSTRAGARLIGTRLLGRARAEEKERKKWSCGPVVLWSCGKAESGTGENKVLGLGKGRD
ncbi:hypothetical protein BOO35_18745 [Vibrio navarrensis]|nr:hypothetical protein [Vibrio navarrensis]